MASEPRFYVLKDEYRGPHDTAAEYPFGFESGPAPECPKCGRAIGMREWRPPFQVELTVYGAEGAGDFVKCSGDSLLISERMAGAIRSEGLSGFRGLEPVEVVKMNARAKRVGIPKYRSLLVAYGHAAVDEVGSRVRRSEPISCDECRSTGIDAIYGFRIQPGTWDGLDAFRPRGLQSRVVVSERVAGLVQRHGFTNLELIPTEDYVHDPQRRGPPAETARA